MYRRPTDGVVGIVTIAVILLVIISSFKVIFVVGADHASNTTSSTIDSTTTASTNSKGKESKSTGTINDGINIDDNETLDEKEYRVESVIDGDTFKINYDGELTSVRLIGVNTPETVDPRTTIECFGQEASDYLKRKLTGKTIRISSDNTQVNRDKYNRLLRYAYLDGQDVGLSIISDGYGYEYTYSLPYAHQTKYKKAQYVASSNNKGLWSPNACNGNNSAEENITSTSIQAPAQDTSSCAIKGNISTSGEKIYHVPGQQYYNATEIDATSGERWFCSEAEAQAAGWRKSKV